MRNTVVIRLFSSKSGPHFSLSRIRLFLHAFVHISYGILASEKIDGAPTSPKAKAIRKTDATTRIIVKRNMEEIRIHDIDA